jgi:hypothetical protein
LTKEGEDNRDAEKMKKRGEKRDGSGKLEEEGLRAWQGDQIWESRGILETEGTDMVFGELR